MAETRQTGDERNRTNPGEFGQNQTNRAKPGKNGQKAGIFRQKRGKKRAKLGKKRAKTGKKRANKTKPWQNRAKPKVSPNLGSGSVIPDHDHRFNVFFFLTSSLTSYGNKLLLRRNLHFSQHWPADILSQSIFIIFPFPAWCNQSPFNQPWWLMSPEIEGKKEGIVFRNKRRQIECI